ncbi:AraC-like DNA-binding protein [Cohnella sp. SGD-V74]|uniref:helix-turn-helix domain-containing protein n=1 Tax=unclassified Cohnella TaxID=2636738 RepID=UPI000D3FE8A3|nr:MULTISPECIES: helix-turn-helix domain-containing protein [unclassified Cohnella]PRX74354.1 AraC-like DNA-binding protein [Cohnella sp. SGD-V74]
MKLIRRINRDNWFIRLLLPYAFFLVMALTASGLIYRSTLDLVAEEERNNHMHLLSQVKSTLDGRLAEIDTLAMKVANDPGLLQLQQIKQPFEGTNPFKLLTAQKGLYHFNVTNKFILNYMVYYRSSEIVLAPSMLYLSDAFYGLALDYDGMTYDQWHRTFFEGDNRKYVLPAMSARYKGKPHSIVTYSYPLGTIPSVSRGSVVMLIDNDQILKLLKSLVVEKEGWAYIADNQGNVISSIGDFVRLDPGLMAGQSGWIEESLRTRGMLVTHTRSSENGWYYVLAQSPRIALAKVNYIKRITLGTTLAFMAVGLVLAYFFTFRNSRKVSRVLDSHYSLREEMRNQEPFLRASIIERLLKGEIVGSEMESMMKRLRINPRISAAATAIVQFIPTENVEEKRLKELARLRILLREISPEWPSGTFHWHDVSEDKIVLLVLESDMPQEECARTMKSLFDEMMRIAPAELRAGLLIAEGGIYSAPIDVSRSYGEAKQALNYAHWRQLRGVILFRELPDLSDSHYYPGEIETRLMNHAKAGDYGEVGLLLDDVYERNFRKRNLPSSIQKLLLYEMAGSLMKLKDQPSAEEDGKIEALLRQTDEADNPAEAFESVRALYADICDRIVRRKKSRNVQLLERIRQIVHAQYGNPALNLDAVADQAGISRVYFSNFFKEQTGINFSDYLENLRMDQARSMLRDVSATVNEIAQRSGYGSTNSFSRAFKRIHGISPTAYRDSSSAAEDSQS